MEKDDPEIPGADHPRGLNEVPLLERDEIRPDEPGHPHPAGQADHDHDVPDGGLQQRDHGQNEEEGRKAEHDVHEPHDHRVHPPAVVAGHRPEHRPDQDGNPGRHETHFQRNPRPPDHPGEDIPPERIRTKGVPPRGRRKDVLQVDRVRIVRGKPGRKQGDDEQQDNDDASHDRHPVLPESFPEILSHRHSLMRPVFADRPAHRRRRRAGSPAR